MSKIYSTANGNLTLTPRGTLYRPVLGTGPLIPVNPPPSREIYRTPSTELALDQTGRVSPGGTSYIRRTGSNDFNPESAVTTGLGILGPASVFAPALAAPVAAAGLGYGIYKAGQAFKIW